MYVSLSLITQIGIHVINVLFSKCSLGELIRYCDDRLPDKDVVDLLKKCFSYPSATCRK